ncbi:hypothetical protein ACFQL4_05565 [Halosimplex aquaticum]
MGRRPEITGWSTRLAAGSVPLGDALVVVKASEFVVDGRDAVAVDSSSSITRCIRSSNSNSEMSPET